MAPVERLQATVSAYVKCSYEEPPRAHIFIFGCGDGPKTWRKWTAKAETFKQGLICFKSRLQAQTLCFKTSARCKPSNITNHGERLVPEAVDKDYTSHYNFQENRHQSQMAIPSNFRVRHNSLDLVSNCLPHDHRQQILLLELPPSRSRALYSLSHNRPNRVDRKARRVSKPSYPVCRNAVELAASTEVQTKLVFRDVHSVGPEPQRSDCLTLSQRL